jgi:hypothetical protein
MVLTSGVDSRTLWTTDEFWFLFLAGKEYFYLLQSLQICCDWDLKLIIYFHLVTRLRMSAITLHCPI